MAIQSNKYLTFTLGDESYAIPILKVKEIIGMMTITKVPKMPEFMRGVINLRGKIIPVTDLRLKFGLPEREYSDRTCIVVIEMDTAMGRSVNGVVVDSVSEVIDIGEENIEKPPGYGGTDEEQEFLTGIGKVRDKVIMLLDTDQILTSAELTRISNLEA